MPSPLSTDPGLDQEMRRLPHITEKQTAEVVDEQLALEAAGRAAGRASDSDITVFDSSGTGLQDL